MRFVIDPDAQDTPVLVSLSQDGGVVDILLNHYVVASFIDGRLIRETLGEMSRKELRSHGIAITGFRIEGD